MFFIEKLSNSLSLKISSYLNLSEDQKEIIAYGAFNLIQTIWCIFVVLLLGVIFSVTAKAFIISFVISILRKYSGGAHSSSPNRCALIGAIVSVGLALIIKYTSIYINYKIVMAIGVSSFLLAYYIIYKYAPVDSTAKSIIKEVTRQKMKKKSFFVLNALATVVIVILISYLIIGLEFLLITVNCIYAGVLWQVITLTPKGCLALLKIDILFKYLTEKFGGENNEKQNV
ncbi:accessory gene regulator ArgB-like protein [Clostridium magnum]|uniref:Accessory gene regulator protein B n=1 Tax=Clostridium magnum DSM 2767 TaxID=1121326 RepID=A0A162R5J2_9CLOT|nr:accessory gene regulator B family protein [Clostridium magnum]KZL89459.1 accessory gene regulator protein B [Clostridium magnum DSM 2767]SHI20200.1 accessory gene regulator B [Clostridium magnum DSM 2767]